MMNSLMHSFCRFNRLAVATLGLAMALAGNSAEGQNSSLLTAPRQTPQMAAGAAANAMARVQNGGRVEAQLAQFPMDANSPAANTQRPYPQGPYPQNQYPPSQPNSPPQGGPVGYPPVDPRGAARAPVSLAEASWTYQAPPPLRVFQVNDIVTIRVDEITSVMAEGAAENRKRTLYEAILTDWIKLNDFRLRPDPQVEGDPAVGAESNSNYRAEATVESRESLTFNIAATVVDIRPNGTLVLEGTKTIRVNDNLWETSISGLCRAEDIGPDNVVLSRDMIDTQIGKQDRGHLRDGYKRGWFQRWFDRVQPF